MRSAFLVESYASERLKVLSVWSEFRWEQLTTFFDVSRLRAWVMTRRLTHTSHHRGQQMAMLRARHMETIRSAR